VKRILVFLAVFLPSLALVHFLSGGTFKPARPSPPLGPDAARDDAAESLSSGAGGPDPDEDEAPAGIRLGSSPAMRRLSAVDFDLRLYREVIETSGRKRFLRSIDFHGDRSESVTGSEISISNPRITIHEILDPFAPKERATRPVAIVTARRGRLLAAPGSGGGGGAEVPRYDVCRLEGDVVLEMLADGALLETSAVDCSFDERIVRTEEPVEIHQGGATLVGAGLFADTVERRFSVLADATLVGVDPQSGGDAVLVAPRGIEFVGADPEGDAPRGGTARASGGVRLELWRGRRGDDLEPVFEAEARDAVAGLVEIEKPEGDPMGAASRSLRTLTLSGGVSFADARGISGRADALVLDRAADRLELRGGPVVDIDARGRSLPPALGATAKGEVRRILLGARDTAIVTGLGGVKPAAGSSLVLRGAARVRPEAGAAGEAGGGLSGEEIHVALDPPGKSDAGAPVAVREISAFGGAALDLPGAGRVEGPEIRLSSPGGDGPDFEVVIPSRAVVTFPGDDGLFSRSLPHVLRGGPVDTETGPALVIARSEGPFDYVAPRDGAPGRLRLTQSVEVEERRGGERTFLMTCRNAEAALGAEPGGAVRLDGLAAQGKVTIESARGTLRARRADFDPFDRTLAAEGEPVEIDVKSAESGAIEETLRAAEIRYLGALGVIEAAGAVEAVLLELPPPGAGGRAAVRSRLSGADAPAGGSVTLRCGKLRALVPETASGFEFEDLLAEIAVEVESRDGLASGDALSSAGRGAPLTLTGSGDRPARLSRPSPDDPSRRETVTGMRLVLVPADEKGSPDVVTLPEGGDVVLYRARSKDPFAVTSIRDASERGKPREKGIVRTAVTTNGSVRLETGREIRFDSKVRIEQTDEAGALVARIEGDRLTLELSDDPADDGGFVAATLEGAARFETPQAKGSGGTLVYDRAKNRLWLKRAPGGRAELRIGRSADVSGTLIEYDLSTDEASLHDYEIIPR